MTIRFLSRGEIADHLGVTLATVKGYASFPEPDVIVGRNQGWALATIDAWRDARILRAAERRAVVDDQPDLEPASLT